MNEVRRRGPLNFDWQNRFECVFNSLTHAISTDGGYIHCHESHHSGMQTPSHSSINWVTPRLSGTPHCPAMATTSIRMLARELRPEQNVSGRADACTSRNTVVSSLMPKMQKSHRERVIGASVGLPDVGDSSGATKGRECAVRDDADVVRLVGLGQQY